MQQTQFVSVMKGYPQEVNACKRKKSTDLTRCAISLSLFMNCLSRSLHSNIVIINIAHVVVERNNAAQADCLASSTCLFPMNFPTLIDAAIPTERGILLDRKFMIMNVVLWAPNATVPKCPAMTVVAADDTVLEHAMNDPGIPNFQNGLRAVTVNPENFSQVSFNEVRLVHIMYKTSTGLDRYSARANCQ